MSTVTTPSIFAYSSILKSGFLLRCIFVMLLAMSLAPMTHLALAQGQRRSPATAKKPLTEADVEKLWKTGADLVLAKEVDVKGLGFAPSFQLVDETLPKVTGVPVAKMPSSTQKIRALVPKLDLAEVSSKAPDLFSSLKTAAQKKSDADMLPLVDPSIMAAKTLVYDIFDPATFKAYSLGKSAENKYGDVSMPFFELNSSNVEKLYYVRITQFKGKYIIGDFITGPEVADFYLHDEQTLAKSDLETMFRALNDGDQSGLKSLCAPGLYDAIQTWGGNKHPGDRLSHGHTVNQVSVESSVPLDQKSIRVVTKVSYPLSAKSNIVFLIDFERVDNTLKMVRIRDDENKVIVYDPNIDNYLNRRYGLPDAPVMADTDVVLSEKLWAQSLEKLKTMALRVLQYHDVAKIAELGQILVEQAPTLGDGYGIRGAGELMQRNFEAADTDAHKAIDLNGTAYFIVERKSLTAGTPFSPVVVGVSAKNIEFRPIGGGGIPETVEVKVITKVEYAKGFNPGMLKGVLPGVSVDAGPYLKFEFKGPDGKKKNYDFADFDTACPKAGAKQASDLISMPSNAICGTTGASGPIPGTAPGIEVLTPQTWREDLGALLQTINTVRGKSGK